MAGPDRTPEAPSELWLLLVLLLLLPSLGFPVPDRHRWVNSGAQSPGQ